MFNLENRKTTNWCTTNNQDDGGTVRPTHPGATLTITIRLNYQLFPHKWIQTVSLSYILDTLRIKLNVSSLFFVVIWMMTADGNLKILEYFMKSIKNDSWFSWGGGLTVAFMFHTYFSENISGCTWFFMKG